MYCGAGGWRRNCCISAASVREPMFYPLNYVTAGDMADFWKSNWICFVDAWHGLVLWELIIAVLVFVGWRQSCTLYTKRKTAYISSKREQKKRSNRRCIRECVCGHDMCPGGFCISRLIGWDVDAIMMPIAFTSLVYWRHWWGFWLSLLWLPHVDKRLLKYWWR